MEDELADDTSTADVSRNRFSALAEVSDTATATPEQDAAAPVEAATPAPEPAIPANTLAPPVTPHLQDMTNLAPAAPPAISTEAASPADDPEPDESQTLTPVPTQAAPDVNIFAGAATTDAALVNQQGPHMDWTSTMDDKEWPPLSPSPADKQAHRTPLASLRFTRIPHAATRPGPPEPAALGPTTNHGPTHHSQAGPLPRTPAPDHDMSLPPSSIPSPSPDPVMSTAFTPTPAPNSLLAHLAARKNHKDVIAPLVGQSKPTAAVDPHTATPPLGFPRCHRAHSSDIIQNIDPVQLNKWFSVPGPTVFAEVLGGSPKCTQITSLTNTDH
jgi:hypothetical protein